MSREQDNHFDVLDSEAEAVRSRLAGGQRPSVIANELHARGLGNISLIYVFRKATGAGIGELKGLGRWWGEAGVTDADAFDAEAGRIFSEARRHEQRR